MISAEHRAAQVCTYLCEGNNPLAHALIAVAGYEQALAWVREYATGSSTSQDFSKAIERSCARGGYVKRTMQAWQLRLSTYQEISDTAMKRMGVSFLIPGDEHWPVALDDLAEPVLGLWVRGHVEVLNRPAIALVGSRAASSYGQRLAWNLASDISDTHVVVSGGAFGIDSQVHRGALDNSQPTIIVSAGGVDRPYPTAHTDLFNATIASGAVLSESVIGAAPQRHRFLSRNRIIAGLGSATVVVEAPVRSGALSTARHAIGNNRPVGACPGSLDSPNAQGCHLLIRNGATLIRHSEDIRELVSWQQLTLGRDEDIFVIPDDGYDPLRERVWEAIPITRSVHTTAIAHVAGMSERDVLAKLSLLELSGRIAREGNRWKRVPSREK